MKQSGAVLLVDDDEDILVAGKLLLKRHFSDVNICNQPENIPRLLSHQQFDVILLDMNFSPGESSGQQGYLWLEKILSISPQAVVIMITAHGDIDIAVDTIKKGATDFIAKPWNNDKVVATVSTALKLSQSRREASELRHTNHTLTKLSNQDTQPMLGQSPAMRQVQQLIERCGPTDANVLLLGENGTGKEVVARQIHNQSARQEQIFVTVDLGAVPESLFESELFGHKKGAFTGANENRTGRIQAADGGTLFLDEIGNLPLHLQAKLLSVLAQRQVTPVGANQSTPFNVRVLAATNMPQDKLRDESLFRQDLLFRLNTVEIQLPPLRERQSDGLDIAEYYLQYYARKYQKSDLELGTDARQAILDYSWPGNIRELRHAIERAVILSQQTCLSAQDLQLRIPDHSPPQTQVNKERSNETVQTGSLSMPQFNPSDQKEFNLEVLEKQIISQALRTYHFNISHTAKALGLTRAALYRRMEKHDL